MNALRRWLDGWRMLSIEEAEALTGIWGVLIAMSILAHSPERRLNSLRKRDVIKWAEKNRYKFSSSFRR